MKAPEIIIDGYKLSRSQVKAFETAVHLTCFLISETGMKELVQQIGYRRLKAIEDISVLLAAGDAEPDADEDDEAAVN